MAAVWAQMATGQGHSQLEESMSVIGVPVMTKASFITTERDIGEQWKAELQQSMAEAGQEEKRLAEEKGKYHEGVPAITVMVDGLSVPTSIPIMRNQVWPSSLGKRRVDSYTSGYVTSSVILCQRDSTERPCLLQELDGVIL